WFVTCWADKPRAQMRQPIVSRSCGPQGIARPLVGNLDRNYLDSVRRLSTNGLRSTPSCYTKNSASRIAREGVRTRTIRSVEGIAIVTGSNFLGRWRGNSGGDNKTVAEFIDRELPAASSFRQQIGCDSISDEFFNGIAHRTGAELWMKSAAHNERQHCRIG